MEPLLEIVLYIFLLMLFFQDITQRKIHALLPFAIFGISISLTKEILTVSLRLLVTNIILFAVIFMLMVLYMSFKKRIILNPFQTYFGLGDFLYFLSVTPLFLSPNYLIYFISSLLFSLLMYIVFLKPRGSNTIPLAGFSALFLFGILVCDNLIDSNSITLLD